jgi:Mechanosensitive ion channel
VFEKFCIAVAKSHPDVLPDPGPEVIFVGLGDSSLNFELRVWTIQQVQTPARLQSDLYFAIFEAFRKENIEMPFPQRDLHIRSIAEPLAATLSSRARAAQRSSHPARWYSRRNWVSECASRLGGRDQCRSKRWQFPTRRGQRERTQRLIRSFDLAYIVMNGLAAVVAGYGLFENSPAVVIGAMIIAMLLGPFPVSP